MLARLGPRFILSWALTGTAFADAPTALRVFRKAIGRDPSAAELTALRELPYEQLVDTVLGSAQFQQEGFYALHRERLLLGREGTQATVTSSYADYCALRLETAEAAGRDARETDAYWSLLRYGERWLPLGTYVPAGSCFFGTTMKQLVAAFDQEEAPAKAKECVTRLKRDFPGVGYDPEVSREKLDELIATLRGLDAARQDESLLETSDGEAMLLATVQSGGFDDEDRRRESRRDRLRAGRSGQGDAAPRSRVEGAPRLSVRGCRHEDDGSLRFRSLDGSRRRRAALSPCSRRSARRGRGCSRRPRTIRRASWRTCAARTVRSTCACAPRAASAWVYGSPLWLSLHRSNPRNQHLHRARVIYHSYFCADVNPTRRTRTGGRPCTTRSSKRTSRRATRIKRPRRTATTVMRSCSRSRTSSGRMPLAWTTRKDS